MQCFERPFYIPFYVGSDAIDNYGKDGKMTLTNKVNDMQCNTSVK